MIDTRRNILEKNFDAIHLHGFQGLRPDKVIAQLGITKGAFYHYFPSKLELGYAVVDEVIAPRYTGLWLQLDHYQGHPVEGIIAMLNYLGSSMNEESCKLGCPLNNLVNEMAPLDEGFKKRLEGIMHTMHQATARALQRAANNGSLQAHIDPQGYAYFVLAAIEGCFSVAKSMQSKVAFDAALAGLISSLRSIKAPNA